MIQRGNTRSRYNVSGNGCTDCLAARCSACHVCDLVQESREIQSLRTVMGNSPIVFPPSLLHSLYSALSYIPFPWLGFSSNITATTPENLSRSHETPTSDFGWDPAIPDGTCSGRCQPVSHSRSGTSLATIFTRSSYPHSYSYPVSIASSR